MKSLKKTLSTCFPVLLCLLSFLILSYIPLSNYLQDQHHSEVLTRYQETVTCESDAALDALWEDAVTYNTMLACGALSDTDMSYEALLNPAGDSLMGSVEIPALGISLPIRHGVSAQTLEDGIGHLPGSSLPVGGFSTHTVLSGHSGMAQSRMFTDLCKLKNGDLFKLHILNRTLVYEVDNIYTVLPSDTSLLRIVPEEDLATLVTCTPVGINTHRLLVRGHRIEASESLKQHKNS